jgi:hypothetical protein
MNRYPDLADSSFIKTSLAQFVPTSRQQPDSAAFDPQRLSSIILTRKMQRDPNAVICSAEAAGGSCADSTCADIHFDKDLQRPDGKYPFFLLIGVLTIGPDGSLIEYLSRVISSKHGAGKAVDPAHLERLVTKAKGVLGLNDSIAQKSRHDTTKSKKKAARTTYDMSVAQEIVTTVCSMIQDDDDELE